MRPLFRPVMLGPVEIANRVVMAPMGLGIRSYDETWPKRYFPFIEERCRGETGLIITHFTNATSLATTPIVGIYDDRFLDSHRCLTDLVHRYATKIFLQLAAFGGKGGGAAPSAVETPVYPTVPRELSVGEIEQIIQDFGQSAARARRAGFDGVEIHAAYHYLVGAFLSPHTNRRKDRYGGDFERRIRFAVEIVQAIRHHAGADFPVGFKFSMWEELEDGLRPELGVRIAQRMAQEGICYLHVTSTATNLGMTARQFAPLASLYRSRNALMPLVRMVKQAVRGIPVIAAGSIIDPVEAEQIIVNEAADLVALGRALLADPHWPRKARVGERIRPCIRCNLCHHYLNKSYQAVTCTVNPYLSLETQVCLPPIRSKKKVMVIGGGPAGMVAALTAAARGHRVSLYEKKDALGGELIPGSQPPFKAELGHLLRYWREEVADSEIEVRLGTEVNPDLVRQEKPDALIVAVGAVPLMPAIPGIQRPNVVSAIDAFLQPKKFEGKQVVVLGGGEVGCECAAFLAQHGCVVTLVEILDDLLLIGDLHPGRRLDLLNLLRETGVDVLTSTRAIKIESDCVTLLRDSAPQQSLRTDWVVVAVGMTPLRQVAHVLAAECPDVYIVGDCVKPRQIRDAVAEGGVAGRLV
ncbi:MAG: oxidoreductase [Anaerolineae bacterium]